MPANHGKASSLPSLAFPQCQRRQQLVADVGGGDSGDLGVVVGRGHLHDVGAHEVEVRQRPEDREELGASVNVSGSSRTSRRPPAGTEAVGGLRSLLVA